jgi:hypothetical protein
MIRKPHPREEKGKAKMRVNPLLWEAKRTRGTRFLKEAGFPGPFRQELLYG